MEQQPDFSKDSEYVFVGDINRIDSYKGDKGQLGKFITYEIIVDGIEFIEKGKAIFDNGYIYYGYYNLVKLVPDMIDTFKNMAIHNLALLDSD